MELRNLHRMKRKSLKQVYFGHKNKFLYQKSNQTLENRQREIIAFEGNYFENEFGKEWFVLLVTLATFHLINTVLSEIIITKLDKNHNKSITQITRRSQVFFYIFLKNRIQLNKLKSLVFVR